MTAPGAAHAEAYEVVPGGGPNTIALETNGTYYGWVTATQGAMGPSGFVGWANNATADRLVVRTGGAGRYRVTAALSFAGTAGVTFRWTVHKGGVAQANLSAAAKLDAGGDAQSVSISGLVDLAEGDYLDLRVKADADAASVTLHAVNVAVERITE